MPLRAEARPTDWKQLDDTQRTAFKAVVRMIGEAIDALPLPSAAQPAAPDPMDWLSSSRASRTVFLSGGRGTGKTTLLASLIKYSLRETAEAPDLGDRKLNDWLTNMRVRVAWLEPIDMEHNLDI
jgi:predicted ATPase